MKRSLTLGVIALTLTVGAACTSAKPTHQAAPVPAPAATPAPTVPATTPLVVAAAPVAQPVVAPAPAPKAPVAVAPRVVAPKLVAPKVVAPTTTTIRTTDDPVVIETPPTTTTTAPRPVTTTTTQPAGPRTSFSNGTYQVGVDIVPGLYRTAGGASCYWKKSSADGGIIDNYIQDGPAVVIIESSVATFTTSRCGTWNQNAPATPAATFGNGTYEVGVDIQPGTYATPGGSSCYWAKRSSDWGIIDNYIQDGPAVVTIEPGTRFFQSNRCGTWTKR